MGQMLQAAGVEIKFGLKKEEIKQAGETQRTLLTTTTKAHDTEMIAATKRHDTETRALTAQNVAEIDGLVELLLKHVDTRHLEIEIAARDAEQRQKASMDASTATAQ
jgi:2',3'-cyclic-nucleotide 2'-phosphodiesterase (5'-nucleotidase family)